MGKIRCNSRLVMELEMQGKKSDGQKAAVSLNVFRLCF